MALRSFKDVGGKEWTAWNTQPMGGQPFAPEVPLTGIRPSFRHGWLTFTSGDEKRRLAPIPDGWADRTDAELRQLLAQAS